MTPGRPRGPAGRLARSAGALTAVFLLSAQGYGQREMLCPGEVVIPYDGRFAFARLVFDPSDEAGYRDLKWNHDCPRAETHFAKLLKELTLINPYLDGGTVLRMDDPELFKYPFSYMSEPGFWTMNEQEVASLRAYLLKGGFLIFDDFNDWHFSNFDTQLHRVLPNAQLVQLDVSNPVYRDAFFRMKSLDFAPPYGGSVPIYLGVYEDNDPRKRLLLIANYNNDIGEYWEWSDMGYVPIELSNEAYKLGVNYVVYAMTH